MKEFQKVTIALMSIVMSLLTTLWAFIWGWGLTPRSWAVIILAAVLQFGISVVTAVATSD